VAANQILQIASSDTGTNLLTQAEYAADAQRPTGNLPGVARSKLVNKALRQTSLMAAGVAQFIADKQPNDVVDTATPAQIASWLEEAVRSYGMPAGTVITLARNTAPPGFLKADGAVVSRATYANLFSAIGTTFGAGDGSTTFGLPDLRGEFVRGWDDGRGVDLGRIFGSAQGDQIRAHTHTTDISASLTAASGAGQRAAGGSLASGSFGGGETRPRSIALLTCIKF